MTTPELHTTEMPSLPEIGALDWGPDVNACLVWLYEQMANNALSLSEQDAQIVGLQNQVAALQGEVTTLQGQVFTMQERLTALESRPEYIFSSTPWQYSNGVPPATGNQIRLDNANLSLATMIDVRLLDSDGADRSNWFRMLDDGSVIWITDWNDASSSHRYRVTGPPTIGATNAQIPVAWITGTGVIPNAKVNVGFLAALKL